MTSGEKAFADAAFVAGREFQNRLCIPKLRMLDIYAEALLKIRDIKSQFPFDAADAATECIRIAKVALKEGMNASS